MTHHISKIPQTINLPLFVAARIPIFMINIFHSCPKILIHIERHLNRAVISPKSFPYLQTYPRTTKAIKQHKGKLRKRQ